MYVYSCSFDFINCCVKWAIISVNKQRHRAEQTNWTCCIVVHPPTVAEAFAQILMKWGALQNIVDPAGGLGHLEWPSCLCIHRRPPLPSPIMPPPAPFSKHVVCTKYILYVVLPISSYFSKWKMANIRCAAPVCLHTRITFSHIILLNLILVVKNTPWKWETWQLLLLLTKWHTIDQFICSAKISETLTFIN